MIALGIIGVYAVGWYLAAPRVVRELPKARGRCHRENNTKYQWSHRSLCRDDCGPGCWRSDGVPAIRMEHVAVGTAVALLWPLVALAFDVRRRANSKPSCHDLTASIARLERELNIGGDQ